MLVQPGLQVDGLDRDLLAVEVVASDVHVLGAGDPEIQSRHRQAAFFVLPLTVEIADNRVHDGPGAAIAYFVDEQTAPDTYLRGRQPKPVCDFQCGVHVFGEPGDAPVDLGDLLGAPLQHGVSKGPDPVGGGVSHVATFYEYQASCRR